MKYTPLSEEELNSQYSILTPGYGNFTILDAEDTVSQSGNDMIKVQLKVWDKDGKCGCVFDYFTSSEKMQWKIKHFLESLGKGDEYGKGEIKCEDLEGLSGKLELRLEKSEKYGEQAKVKDYLPLDSNVPAPPKEEKPKTNEASVSVDDSDLPF